MLFVKVQELLSAKLQEEQSVKPECIALLLHVIWKQLFQGKEDQAGERA